MHSSGPDRSPTGESDADVVARVRAGDRDAYRTLVRRYQDILFRHAVHMTGSGDVAADLVQATFVKAYAHIGRCREPDRFGAWVFRILANGCKDHVKSRRRRDVSLDGEPYPTPFAKSDPSQDLERSEMRTLLEGAIAELPEIQREAFLLKHVDGRSYEEIATLLNVSISALKMRVLRAREALRAALEEVL